MIEQYVNDIYNALHNKCYYSALALTLTLPDMCGMAEYPNEDVGKRYINWIDKYLSDYFYRGKGALGTDNPCLTGELIYNLRNAFLHQGSPSIQVDKIKKESNQLDVFTIILGDGETISDYTRFIESPECKDLQYREIGVEINYLCNSICECALWYYKQNKDKFKFDVNVISQKDVLNL